MRIPDYPQPGPVRLEWGRSVVDAIRAIWPQSSPTIEANVTAGGTTYRAKSRAISTPAEPARLQPLQLFAATTDTVPPQPRLKLTPSTLANSLPSEPDTDDGGNLVFVPQSGVRYVHGKVVIDPETGAITERVFIHGSVQFLEDTSSEFYVLVGTYKFAAPPGGGASVLSDVANYRYGPIDARVCRDWFATPPNLFTLTFVP